MATYIPYAFFDPPQVLDTAVTPIPASSASPMQVIADTGIQIGVGVVYSDNTGQFIGVYAGAAGQEALVCIIGNGKNADAPVFRTVPPHSRISIRSLANFPITAGQITATLVTS